MCNAINLIQNHETNLQEYTILTIIFYTVYEDK